MSGAASQHRATDGPALLDQYPVRFSVAEMRRRRTALIGLLAEHGLDHLVVYGAQRAGSAVGWLSGWPVTREAAVILGAGSPDVLFVQFRNHVPSARELADPAVTVRWGGGSTIDSVVAELTARGGSDQRVGVIGPLPHRPAAHLAAATGALVPLDAAYTQLRLVKSGEELDWLRAGAWLSDRGIDALTTGLRTGMSEREIVDLAERAYVPQGGSTHICYVTTTSMHRPERCVPGQFPSPRRLGSGDVVVVELSASFWGYAGQVLRTFAVDEPLTPLYRDLHAVADAALDAVLAVVRAGTTPAQIQDASAVIEDAGYTTCDDLLHGFGGGYLPPVIASRSHTDAPLPGVPLAAGMTVVVQPNVVTTDGRAGVQTGELVHVTANGFERLHDVAPGPVRVAPSADTTTSRA